jgi:serine protease Do
MKRVPLVVISLVLGASLGAYFSGAVLHGTDTAPAASPRELTSYRDVVKKVLPAVVSIEAKARTARPKRRPSDFQDKAQSPDEPSNFGSGVLVDPKGIVLTNFHVVEEGDQVEVQLYDGRKFLSRDIKSDPKTDLAIVRIETKVALPYLDLGDSDAMEIGDRVLAVGAPFRLTGTVTAGIVSAKGRNLRLHLYEDFLQTDAAINPGNSGGPLINLEGKVIGINSAIKTRTGGFQGVGLAIASNLVRNVMTQLLKDGAVHRGYLGLQMRNIVSDEIANRLGLKEAKGVLVTSILDGSPAYKGGVQEGDVIVSVAGKPVQDDRQLQAVIAAQAPGKPVEVAVVRDGKPLAVRVTLVEQPNDFGPIRVPVPKLADLPREGLEVDKIGVEAVDLTPELAQDLGFREGTKGAVIVRLDREGLAAEAGLLRGMLVTKVDRKPVASAKELKELVGAGSAERGLMLLVQSARTGAGYVLLKPSGN